jgi:hypothetical protein
MRFCKDCKHYSTTSRYEPACNRTRRVIYTSKVDGEETIGMRSCFNERLNRISFFPPEIKCGPKGIYFEPRGINESKSS